jgi:Spx/MgsR family transcriptional regulator
MTTIYGLPNCDSCKKARNWLDRFGIAHAFVDYKEQRTPAETLKAWAAQLGGWSGLVNKQSTTWRNLPDTRKAPHSDPEWTLLLKEYPALIKRPVLVADDGTVSVGFSDNGWKKRFHLQDKAAPKK